MNIKTILCYGDSNTYGYDPRDPLGGRYEPEYRWCDLLEKGLHCRVVNYGENGRNIPTDYWGYPELFQTIRREKPDLCVILLGTNDILNGRGTLEEISRRTETFLMKLHENCPEVSILLLSPPQINLKGLHSSAEELSALYCQAAQRQGVDFLDSFRWNTPLSFDGVHLSEEGHRIFAEHLVQELKKRT